MFKVVIVGGKDTGKYALFEKRCIHYLEKKASEGIMIYTTGDEYVERFSKRFRIDIRYFLCNFKKKKDALDARNEEMLADADAVIAFDNGMADVRMIIDKATEKNIPLRVAHI